MLAFAQLGDLEAAFGYAAELYPGRRGRTAAEDERIWLDSPGDVPLAILTARSAAPLRRDPRYLLIADRVGLLAYWRSGRLPDFCTLGHEPVCQAIERAR